MANGLNTVLPTGQTEGYIHLGGKQATIQIRTLAGESVNVFFTNHVKPDDPSAVREPEPNNPHTGSSVARVDYAKTWAIVTRVTGTGDVMVNAQMSVLSP